MRKIISSVLGLVFIASCNFFSNDERENALARVGDNYLYESELEGINFDEEVDSLVIVQAFVDNWIKEQLLIKKALQNLNESQIDFEEQLENYKNSLVIFAYENLLIRQKLDTNVSANEIVDYYEENKPNFKLKTKVLKARFVKIINSAPSRDSMEHWLFSRRQFFQEDLQDYCTQFAKQCQIDTAVWVPVSDVIRILPPTINFDEVELLINKNIIADSLETLLMDISDIRDAGETSPIYLVRDQIKSIIRNKRKLQLLARVKEEIYEDATLKKGYEVFD